MTCSAWSLVTSKVRTPELVGAGAAASLEASLEPSAGAAAAPLVDAPTASTFTRSRRYSYEPLPPWSPGVRWGAVATLVAGGAGRDVHVVTGGDLVCDPAVGVHGHRHCDQVLALDRLCERAADPIRLRHERAGGDELLRVQRARQHLAV